MSIIKPLKIFLNILYENISTKTTEKTLLKDMRINSEIYLFDYFQSEKYFNDIKNDIKNDFQIKPEIISKSASKIKQQLLTQESVSIHVRRGDYVSHPIYKRTHGSLPLHYYQKAIKIINNSMNNPTFYIFSDDITWCKKELCALEKNIIFVDKLKDYEDLELMMSCKHNIVANSSFSWWAAWLNNNESKIIVAPSNRFLKKKYDMNSLYPKEWIRV